MRRDILAKHLTELPALAKTCRSIETAWVTEFLNEEEKTEYEALRQWESDIDKRVDKAEKAVALQTPEYPAEYKAILKRLLELTPHKEQIEAVQSALFNLNRMVFPQSEMVRSYYLGQTAQEVEYQNLLEAKERRERQNSKVVKLRDTSWNIYNKEVERVVIEIRERLEAKSPDRPKRKAELEQLAESRRQAKLLPVYRQIRELLDSAIELVEVNGGE